jgi:lipoate---protein ligase
MKHLNLTLPSPAENLACEEALLDAAEAGGDGEILRFWEAREPFVVVGYANKIATEVKVAACRAKGVPIYRRCSGGGTVLQGPGCLNYAVILRITADGPLHNITSANRFIMERNRAAIETVLARPPAVSVRGHTDLALDARKFSGNSQRRKKNFLLFHGTFLLHFDLALVRELLAMPSLQPDYRDNRSHDDFLTNLNVPAANVKSALQQAWNAAEETRDFPGAATRQLAVNKYSTEEWNLKF